jgi:hypothetical protein
MARRGRALAAIGAITVAVFAGGCELLFPGAGFADEFPSSSPIATFATGSATIAVGGGETIELTELAKGASIDSLFGSNVHWTGPDGWHVRVTGAGAGAGLGGFAESAYVSIDRIFDGKHWTTMDPSRCIVDVVVADKTRIKGSATCRGLEWYDALDSNFTADGPTALGEPKFDAELTFEAVP